MSAGAWWWREVVPFALAIARLAPVTFLCPLLGGSVAPPTVRLGVALALSGFMVRAAPSAAPPDSLSTLMVALGLEALLGVGIGLAAAAPFDAARVGGRLIDLARGSSAEAALPHLGTRETAGGDLLYQLLVAMAACGLALPLIVGALARGFALVPPGGATLALVDLDEALRVSGGVLATGLAVAGPAIGSCMLVDATFAVATRLGPSFGLQDQLSGVRLLVGAAAFWFGVGGAATALLDHALSESVLLARSAS